MTMSRRELIGYIAMRRIKLRVRKFPPGTIHRIGDQVCDVTKIQKIRLAIGTWAGMNPPRPELWWELFRMGLFSK